MHVFPPSRISFLCMHPLDNTSGKVGIDRLILVGLLTDFISEAIVKIWLWIEIANEHDTEAHRSTGIMLDMNCHVGLTRVLRYDQH